MTAICAFLYASLLLVPASAVPLHVREITRDNLLGYVPSIPLNIAGAIVFGLIALAQTILYTRYKARYMLPMLIGAYVYTAGIIDRFPLRSHLDSIGLLVVQDIFIVLSPCAFIASCYSILGQLGARLNGQAYLPVRPELIAKVFIWSDIITFQFQSAGASLALHASVAKIGTDLLLVGLLLQAISFLVFCAFYTTFLVRLRAHQPAVFASGAWRPAGAALVVACAGLLIRSAYRCVENAQGVNGFLALHEPYFWALDALPCAIAVAAFVVCWPERHIPPPNPEIELQSLNSTATARGAGRSSSGLTTPMGYLWRLLAGSRAPDAVPKSDHSTTLNTNE